MRLSPATQMILKNFSMISKDIRIDPGNELRVDARTGIIAHARVPDTFPAQISLYDLANFLSVGSMFRAPDFDFQEHFVVIRGADGESELKYRYAGPSLIASKRPKKIATLPLHVVEFELPEEKWAAVRKAASALEKPEVRIVSDGRTLSMTTHDTKYPGGHEFSTRLAGDASEVQCNSIFQLTNLKLMPGSYRGTLTPTYGVFTSTSGYDLTYWVGCDPGSTFGLDQ
jgi:hypothetical protein